MKAVITLFVLLLLTACAAADRTWYRDQSDEFKAYEQMQEWIDGLEQESFELYPDVLEMPTLC